MAFLVPVDWEDHQARAEPHASELLTDTGVTADQAPSSLDVSAGTMKAYRSVRVTVTASGSDVDVTAYWSLEGSASGQQPFETQRVTDGDTTSMLFQSQGHSLVQVSFQGVSADATIDYDIVGSNLDPLAVSDTGPQVPWAVAVGSILWPNNSKQSSNASLAMVATNDAARYSTASNHLFVSEPGTYVFITSYQLASDTIAATNILTGAPDMTPGGAHSSSVIVAGSFLRPGNLGTAGTRIFWDLNSQTLYNLAAADVPLQVDCNAVSRASITPANAIFGGVTLTVRLWAPQIADIF